MYQAIQNDAERRTAFWKFLFFFLLSTLFIVSAVYFNVNISDKENSLLNKEVAQYKIHEAAQNKFVSTMDETKHLIDSLNTPGANVTYLNEQIAAKIRVLTDLEYKDSSSFKRLNTNVIDLFLRYQDAATKIVTFGNAPQQLEEYKQKYDQAQRDLDDAHRDLDVLRRSMNSTAVQ